MTKRPVVWKQCYGLQGTRSREWGSLWGGIVERDRHCVKLSSGAGQGAFHGTLTGTVVQRGVTLTPLPLMTSFRQWPIGGTEKRTMSPEDTSERTPDRKEGNLQGSHPEAAEGHT